MILCRWHDYWFTSTGINHDKGFCAVRCGPLMPHPPGFHPLPPSGVVIYGAVSPIEDITFYPQIAYHGCRLWPEYWNPETSEPILRCLAMPGNFHDLDSDYFRDIATGINAQFPGDVLMADGWERSGRAEYVKFLHVDEIEKVEGPPPEGAF